MKKSTKKITDAARQHEFFVLRCRERFDLYCEQCAADAEFVALDEAVLFSGFSTREIVRMTENGKLHSLETSGGHLFICQKSLTAIECVNYRAGQSNNNTEGEDIG